MTVTRLFRRWKILEIRWSTLKHTVEKSNIGGAILWTPKNKTKKITHRITWRPDKGFWEGEAKQGLSIVNANFSETLLPPTPPLQTKKKQQKQEISNGFKNKPGERLNAILAWKSATSHLWKFSDRMSRTLLHRSSIALAAVSKRSAPGKKSR